MAATGGGDFESAILATELVDVVAHLDHLMSDGDFAASPGERRALRAAATVLLHVYNGTRPVTAWGFKRGAR